METDLHQQDFDSARNRDKNKKREGRQCSCHDGERRRDNGTTRNTERIHMRVHDREREREQERREKMSSCVKESVWPEGEKNRTETLQRKTDKITRECSY